MAELKPGWQRVKFGELAECINDRVDDPATAGVDRYVGLEHLDPDTLTIRRWGSPTDVESTKLRFKPGDIIFGKRRAYQRKLAVADFEGICSAHAMVLRAKPDVVLPEFLPFFMKGNLFMERAIKISVGSLSPTINWKTLAQQEFMLPRLEEQRKISVYLIACETQREACLRASMAMEDVAQAFVRDYFAEFAGTCYTGAELSTLITKGESPRWQGFAYEESGVMFITSENIHDREINVTPAKYIPREFHEKLSRSQICAGDVLVNIVGASIGRAAVVPKGIGEANTNQAVALIRPQTELIEPEFMLEWFLSPFGQRIVAGQQVNTARANISLADLRGMQIPCPDKTEQARLLGIVDELRAGARACLIRKVDVYESNSIFL
jgi:type I restriction enzyme S subunit